MKHEYLFVYGTLRKGVTSPMDALLARHCKFYSEAIVRGILYDVGGYPGVIESAKSSDKVYGDLYKVQWASQLWPKLDYYEHCSSAYVKPHQYARKKRAISLDNGETVQAWIYLFNWKTAGLYKIASGDYLSYLKCNS